MRKNAFFLALVLTIAFTLSGCSTNLNAVFQKKLSPDEAKLKAETYINANLMANGSKATIDKVVEENGLYKMSVNVGSGQIIDSYMTKDGSKLFPQALEMKTAETASTDTAGVKTAAPTEVPKTAKPTVELFVMSHCPYGTQIEKGILPVIEALGDKINFAIKFCDYAMHGEKELKEELNQYCINKEQSAKYLTYLKCFLGAGDGAACLTQTKIDTAKLNTCVDKTDKQFKVTENFANNVGFKGSYPAFDVFKDDNAKYNVGGSPTLIINGTESSSARDPQSLMNSICAGFATAPEECAKAMDTASPAAGFGTGTEAASGAAAADCATT
ncbi:hypothetical protein COX68_00185 [Candidatus Falkowbacteria bacterium CG_4_10_14_0_2_um_filter_41_15]|uniref:Thioredoxin-like fold domain-containing protein n=4 Tax=Candidatus Falkowiibacteriota TaxID=1752728 RepID=A0A2G9ZMW7_9BACT|nr:MAG: hypothetical protein AUJ35_01120 [Candidatus Falkowbacteria bacterium CG1_02_41_21]PIP34526.1 MAG: hypothetical protein COX21_02425 [Candidatus Falkowbacteria bacterium CG23_combo_of_CG06-09_8_20_14_all_41_10]PIZ10520.1 MAG: hypothetical protein COY54_01515 [Candidatus Falkowbacteria bacterium CG_4_10_14_0_8_um_filter_41_36]PJA10508.1 MAG: hypothetical protein COX68_00185 [Candidatus Falkowbacteria bacterium CG_4_10_14_0_2_um_filter_41_15]